MAERRAIKKFASCIEAITLALCLPLAACLSGSGMSPELLEALRAEQQMAHSVIGFRDGDTFDYIDVTAGNKFKRVRQSLRQETTRSIDLGNTEGPQESTDGKWIASCTDRLTCKISERDGLGTQFAVSRKDALTALYLSPDDKLAFWVAKAPNWRFPPRCSLEDERDVTVYEVSTGVRGALVTVCGGFPYGSLRWYKLKTP
jgi:hypothetical protein